eukprot:NODE_15703_length_1035_cov_5.428414.p1 GENE.NODE_15703_length_1035_cov_5.428414~~NODE_15703_length_1035_cov_5.428414.p1  ORF type:complete len:245 (-),score=64.10 NODE_15703_length_1035_cov_5.428414:79-813(-)
MARKALELREEELRADLDEVTKQLRALKDRETDLRIEAANCTSALGPLMFVLGNFVEERPIVAAKPNRGMAGSADDYGVVGSADDSGGDSSTCCTGLADASEAASDDKHAEEDWEEAIDHMGISRCRLCGLRCPLDVETMERHSLECEALRKRRVTDVDESAMSPVGMCKRCGTALPLDTDAIERHSQVCAGLAPDEQTQPRSRRMPTWVLFGRRKLTNDAWLKGSALSPSRRAMHGVAATVKH